MGAYLVLQHPVDVSSIEIDNEDPEKNIKIMQLIMENDKDWKKIKEGNLVEMDGTLSHALTGHHHTRVLLTVGKIKIISINKASIQNLNKLDVTDEDWQFLQAQNLQI